MPESTHNADPKARVTQFGVFEVDLQAGELRKSGLRIKLQDQPLQILTLLLETSWRNCKSRTITAEAVAG